jgi:hypothetical protein
MPYTDVVALDSKDYSPPVDARLKAVDDLGNGWKQHVDVDYVDPNHLSSLSGSAVQPAARVTVTAYHNGAAVYTGAWVVTQ